jgi:DNA repair protein RadC
MSITDWPLGERPRERLSRLGAAALSDAEVIAILLGTGTRGCTAVELGREMLRRFGSVRGVIQASREDIMSVPGLGPAKCALLTAALEIARRSLRDEATASTALNSPAVVRDYLRLLLAGREREVFVAVYLDNRHRVLAVEELFQGTLTQTSVHPREVVKAALRHNAAALIVAHNHPSGVAEPSAADRLVTDTLKQTLATVEVRLLDHFVIAAHGAVSLAERGWL